MCENTTDTKQQSDQIDIYKPARVVFQANELVRGEQDNFTLLETKLIRLAISRITKNDKGITPFSCSITELARELKMKKQNVIKSKQNMLKTNRWSHEKDHQDLSGGKVERPGASRKKVSLDQIF